MTVRKWTRNMDLLEILSQGVRMELESYELYREAAEAAGDDDSRTLFTELAQEELRHRDRLQARMEALGSI